MLKVYAYSKCGTCRKAVNFLKERGVAHKEIPIREQPPTRAELKRMLGQYNGEIRRLFNTSGGDYKDLGLKDKLPTMTEAEALDLLASNGNLIKRPFLLGEGTALVGFNPEGWERVFPL